MTPGEFFATLLQAEARLAWREALRRDASFTYAEVDALSSWLALRSNWTELIRLIVKLVIAASTVYLATLACVCGTACLAIACSRGVTAPTGRALAVNETAEITSSTPSTATATSEKMLVVLSTGEHGSTSMKSFCSLRCDGCGHSLRDSSSHTRHKGRCYLADRACPPTACRRPHHPSVSSEKIHEWDVAIPSLEADLLSQVGKLSWATTTNYSVVAGTLLRS